MKTRNTKLLALSLATSFFLILSVNKGLSLFGVGDVVTDPGLYTLVIEGNTTLGTISGTATAIQTDTGRIATDVNLINNFIEQNIGRPMEANGIAIDTATAIKTAQNSTKSFDKKFSEVVQSGTQKSAISSQGNTGLLGSQVYEAKPYVLSPESAAMTSKMPNLLKKYSSVEEAANNYYQVVEITKAQSDLLEENLSQKMTDLSKAKTDAEVQKIQASISALHAQMYALQNKNELARMHLEVLSIANENNDKKQADLSSIKEDDKKMKMALDGVAAFAAKTWD